MTRDPSLRLKTGSAQDDPYEETYFVIFKRDAKVHERRRKGLSKSAGLGPVSTGMWSILRRSSNFFPGKVKFMASNAVEPLPNQVPADDFQALEEKIYRTIEMYKSARQAQATAERDAQRLRQQLEEREEELVRLRRESVQLKKEREDIRGRVEKMLAQIESLAEAS